MKMYKADTPDRGLVVLCDQHLSSASYPKDEYWEGWEETTEGECDHCIYFQELYKEAEEIQRSYGRYTRKD